MFTYKTMTNSNNFDEATHLQVNQAVCNRITVFYWPFPVVIRVTGDEMKTSRCYIGHISKNQACEHNKATPSHDVQGMNFYTGQENCPHLIVCLFTHLKKLVYFERICVISHRERQVGIVPDSLWHRNIILFGIFITICSLYP